MNKLIVIFLNFLRTTLIFTHTHTHTPVNIYLCSLTCDVSEYPHWTRASRWSI